MMESIAKPAQQRFKRRETKIQTIYSRALLTRNIVLPITAIGRNIKETIEENIKANFEEKCVVEGYIKQNSVKIITHSSGLIVRGNTVQFNVVFECEICFPVEGMLIECVAKNITKAGIRGESANEVPSPVVVFIAKDHHYNNDYFADTKEGDRITVRVIGQRFELNDKYISIIGELIKPRVEKDFTTSKFGQNVPKPRLVIQED